MIGAIQTNDNWNCVFIHSVSPDLYGGYNCWAAFRTLYFVQFTRFFCLLLYPVYRPPIRIQTLTSKLISHNYSEMLLSFERFIFYNNNNNLHCHINKWKHKKNNTRSSKKNRRHIYFMHRNSAKTMLTKH